ncbi:MAG: hypothetical protein ACREBB_08110 [Nitrosotalea sp.]
MFCGQCGGQAPDNYKFCPACGLSFSNVQVTQPTPNAISPQSQVKEDEEIEYYRGEGELIVKRTEHRGAGRKAASWLAGGPIGYVAFGRDKTRKTKAEGIIVITNKAIYCAGNDYPFDRILGITKQGTIHKSVILTFEKDVGAGGRSEGNFMGTGGLSVEVELKTKDIEGLFKGLEEAKLHKIKPRK